MELQTFEIPGDVRAVGVDPGSLIFKAVGLGGSGEVLFRHKEPHGGDPQALLDRFLGKSGSRGRRIAVSALDGPAPGIPGRDPLVCLHSAVRTICPGARNILEVGAGHLLLLRLDEEGRIASIHRNSLCAAGTGSFLDAQAARMGIESDNGMPDRWIDDPPAIATRCAVFAKSDLIYRQQEGLSKETLWSGLCRGLAAGLLQTLTRGRPLAGRTVLCGGVALNAMFVEWLRRKLFDREGGGSFEVLPFPEYAAAHGAALMALEGTEVLRAVGPGGAVPAGRKTRPELRLRLSRYPDPGAFRGDRDGDGNEISFHGPPPPSPDPRSGAVDVHLGLDVGSTSTKLVLVDAGGRILLDVYRRTGADPVAAIQGLFRAVAGVSRARGLKFEVRGAAATGSGRKLAGSLIGADLVLNEISAHVAGAVHFDPSLETIFEIGGQDAKYVSVRNREIADANMNYVCAAGTGSFIEEQAAKLGYTVEEIGGAALGTSPPYTSARCTVFMEQDILGLLRQGFSRREAAGSVMYSVIDNYLDQVVGRRPVSKSRIFFQGATARNRGLVAAIENILGVEVVVSPFCHVMGAYGAALRAMSGAGRTKSRFRGFELADKSVRIEEETCGLCPNACRVSRAAIEGERDRPAWGMKCGLEEREAEKRGLPSFALFEEAVRRTLTPAPPEAAPKVRGRVRLPRALILQSEFVFWKSFFEALGLEAELGPAHSPDSLDLGRSLSGPDFCFPLKAAVGQAAGFLRGEERSPVFIPYLLADTPLPPFSHSRFCPYVGTLPSLVKSALGGDGFDLTQLISPVVDLRLSDKVNAAALEAALAPVHPVKRNDVEAAIRRAREARRAHEDSLTKMGREALERLRREGGPSVVVVGRPYGMMDGELNKDVPGTVARLGLEVIPVSCLAGAPEELWGEFRNLFWSTGQRILSVLAQVSRTDGLYAVYLSNFGCGPDSFLLSYAEAIMGDKPFLILEVDEHGAGGGYETRIEAFVEVVRRDREGKAPHRGRRLPGGESSSASEIKKRTLWFPLMHLVGNRFFTAAFRGSGYDARTLPLEDEGTLALGRRRTRGAECLPMSLTLGAFLSQMDADRRSGGKPEENAALFLPTSTGPCRFGQYRTLDRLIFEELGMEDVPILSPGAHNAYYGLPGRVRRRIWKGICGGDILFKMRCRVRPFELTPGDAEETLERWSGKAERLVERNRMRWPSFLEEAMADFLRIPVRREPRPLVGIVGEIYVRCNPFANSWVADAVEKLGGEVWLAPVAEWILYTAWIARYLARREGRGPLEALKLAAKWRYLAGVEHGMIRGLRPLLGDRIEPPMADIIRAGRSLLPPEFQGESILTVGRAILFGEAGADLVVNCAPFGCMHGNITGAIFERMREDLRAPVVNLSYDGTEDNSVLNAFMHEAWRKKR